MVYITIICGHTFCCYCYHTVMYITRVTKITKLNCLIFFAYIKNCIYNKVSYISNCYKKEKNVMYIIKVVNVQCYVYKKEYSLIGSPAPSLLSSIFVDKNHIAHICFAPI